MCQADLSSSVRSAELCSPGPWCADSSSQTTYWIAESVPSKRADARPRVLRRIPIIASVASSSCLITCEPMLVKKLIRRQVSPGSSQMRTEHLKVWLSSDEQV